MSDRPVKTDIPQEIEQLKVKRAALEKLVKIALNVESQQKAMEELSLIARPSQDFPPKVAKYIEQMDQRFGKMQDDELKQRLESIEKVTSQTIERVVEVAQIDVNRLRDDQIRNFSVKDFVDLITEFKRRTQASLAMRFMLKKRGVVIPAFKLPFTQESIAEKIEGLRQREQNIVSQVKREVRTMITDTEKLLNQPGMPEKMVEQLEQVRSEMRENLTHLEKGGGVNSLPKPFEIVTVIGRDSPPPVKKGPFKDQDQPAPIATETTSEPQPEQPADPSPSRRKRSFFGLVWKWLLSPRSMTWKDIKEQHQYLDD